MGCGQLVPLERLGRPEFTQYVYNESMQPSLKLKRAQLVQVLPRYELAISLGAICGASIRFTLSSMFTQFAPLGLPLGTLCINLIGCFLIGIFQTMFLDLIAVRRELQLLISVGFLGGLTTFSSVSVETIRLIQRDLITLALIYQGLLLAGGITTGLLGIVSAYLGYRFFISRKPSE